MDPVNIFNENLSFVEVLFAVILGWILVTLWERAIDNFTFNTLGLNKDSTFHTVVIAIVATAIFLTFIFTFNNLLEPIEKEDIGSIIPPMDGPIGGPMPVKTAEVEAIKATDFSNISYPPGVEGKWSTATKSRRHRKRRGYCYN